MKVDLDAKVRTHDGQDAGHVHRAVFDPINETVTHFLINTGSLLGRDVLVPSQELESATQDGDHIVLRLTKDELKALPDYLPTGYAPAPAGWMAPAGYGLSTETFLWPADAEMMDDDDDEVTLGKGETVLDVDGHDLGVVEDVLLDEESGRLQGFVLRVGGAWKTLFGGGERVTVNRESVMEVGEGIVQLNVAKEDLRTA